MTDQPRSLTKPSVTAPTAAQPSVTEPCASQPSVTEPPGWDAAPAPDEPIAAHTALLTIDVQNDFSLPDAPHTIAGTDALLPAMAEAARAFRSAGLPIVHVVRLYRADGANAELSRRAVLATGPLVRPGTAGSELRAELHPGEPVPLDHASLLAGGFQRLGPREWVMYKPRWGAFYGTGLTGHLRALGVDTVAVAGANFPNCPRTTLYEASERDFRTVLLSDAVSGLYERGLAECAGIGVRAMTVARLGAWLAPAAA